MPSGQVKVLGRMVELRETGSTTVPWPRERVFAVLRDRLAAGAVLRTAGTRRLEWDRGDATSTFILSDVPGGTRVVHARTRRPALRSLPEQDEELRAAVQADLQRIERMCGGAADASTALGLHG